MHDEQPEQPAEYSIQTEATTLQSSKRVKRVWRRAVPITAFSGSLLVAMAVAATTGPGVVCSPSHGSAVRFPATDPTVAISFNGDTNDDAIKVEVYQFGPFPTVPIFLGDQVPFLGDDQKKHFNLALNVSHGPGIWANDDVTTFSVREKLSNGTWQWMETGADAGNDGAPTFPFGTKAVIGVADQPDQVANFPSVFNQPISGQLRDSFLGAKGIGVAGEGLAYYNAMDGIGAPPTLNAWKTAFGFPAGNEVVAHYKNDQDLNLGREMHCRIIAPTQGLPFAEQAACYVSNYPDANQAAQHQGLIATVAMDYIRTRAPDPVRFYVYFSDGNLVTNAVLDGSPGGAKEVPRLCLNCHGGTFNATTKKAENAHFLPFDVTTLPVPTDPDLGPQAQEFKALNGHVWMIEALNVDGAAIADLAQGWYGDVGFGGFVDSNSQFNPFWYPTKPPPSPSNPNPPDEWEPNPRAYLTMIGPYCRTCHIAQNPGLKWTTAGEVAAFASTIKSRVCDKTSATRVMPHAQRAYQKFWESGARAAIAVDLTQFSCAYVDGFPQ